MRSASCRLLIVCALLCLAAPERHSLAASASTTSIRVLYPSFAGSWATSWIAKEAGYFAAEGLDVELIRVGGSTRMVAALLGGSAPIIQAGASAALAATAAGSAPPMTKPKKRPDGIAMIPGSAASISSATTCAGSAPCSGRGPPSAALNSSIDAGGDTGRSSSESMNCAA